MLIIGKIIYNNYYNKFNLFQNVEALFIYLNICILFIYIRCALVCAFIGFFFFRRKLNINIFEITFYNGYFFFLFYFYY